MKIFTNRLWQFAGCASIASIAMHIALNLLVSSAITWIIIAVLYFCTMYAIGWYFGKKDYQENNIYDIGIRWHITTFLICNALSYLFCVLYYNGTLEAVSQGVVYYNYKRVTCNAMVWLVFLVIHFIVFLYTRKNAIKGYNKNEIFE